MYLMTTEQEYKLLLNLLYIIKYKEPIDFINAMRSLGGAETIKIFQEIHLSKYCSISQASINMLYELHLLYISGDYSDYDLESYKQEVFNCKFRIAQIVPLDYTINSLKKYFTLITSEQAYDRYRRLVK